MKRLNKEELVIEPLEFDVISPNLNKIAEYDYITVSERIIAQRKVSLPQFSLISHDVNPKQVVYLDFDGATTSYNGEVISISNVLVEDSDISQKEQENIANALNAQYAGEIVFVTEHPVEGEYSTIFVGKTDSFDNLGFFDGLAETIDKNNKIKNDNAFVFADSSWSYTKTISVISHEIEHIVYGEEHIFVTNSLDDYGTTYDYNITSDYSRSSVFAQNAHTQRGGDVLDIHVYAVNVAANQSVTITVTCDSLSGTNCYGDLLVAFGDTLRYLQKGKSVTLTFNESLYVQIGAYVGGIDFSSYALTTYFSIDIDYTTNQANADLTPYAPQGWDSPIVVSKTTGTNTNSTSITTNDNVYVDFCWANADYANAGKYTVSWYLDNELLYTGSMNSHEALTYQPIEDYSLGKLSAGSHTIKLVLDESNSVTESNESNNTYTKTFTVTQAASQYDIQYMPLGSENVSLSTQAGSYEETISTITTNNDLYISFAASDASGRRLSTGVTASVYIDNTLKLTQALQELELGQGYYAYAISDYSLGKLSAGQHTVKVVLDSNNAITETNENNNTWTKTITVNAPAQPDLLISALSTTASNATTQDSVILNFTVKNGGNASASSSYVYIYDGNQKVGQVAVGSLAAGAISNLSYTFAAGSLSVGSHNLKVVADGASNVAESNENNNSSAEKNITISQPSLPDLLISTFSTSVSSATTLDSVTLNFTIKNGGNATASTSHVYVYDGNQKVGQVAVGALAVGASANLSYTFSAGSLSVGVHNLKVVVDGASKVVESNESNNSSEKSVSITQASNPAASVNTFLGNFVTTNKEDILLHDSSGSVSLYNSGSGVFQNLGTLSKAAWEILDASDFDNDKQTELLIKNITTGTVYITDNIATGISNTKVSSSLVLGILGEGYDIAGAGNFNGSRCPGALLIAPEQVSIGYSKVKGLACWSRGNDQSMSPGWLGAMVTTYDGDKFDIPDSLYDETVINSQYYSFDFVGIGDFNGDGRDDVMIKNTMPQNVDGKRITGSGDVFVFLTGNDISGYQEVNVAYSGNASDPWDIIEVGDFNGDNTDDVLLKNSDSGDIACWLMKNGQMQSSHWVKTMFQEQDVSGVGDVNGDGTDDIVLADSNGDLTAWTMKNGQYNGMLIIA